MKHKTTSRIFPQRKETDQLHASFSHPHIIQHFNVLIAMSCCRYPFSIGQEGKVPEVFFNQMPSGGFAAKCIS